MVEKIKKYTSFVSILFFVGAVWYEFLFYKGFGIDIFSYVSFGEIITLFIGKIPFLILSSLFTIFVGFMLRLMFSGFIERVLKLEELSKKRRFGNPKLFRIGLYVGLVWILTWFGPMMLPIRSSTTKFIESEAYLFIRACGTFLLIFWITIQFIRRPSFNNEKLLIVLFIATFYTLIYYLASFNLWSIKFDYKLSKRVTIILKDSSIINTNDSIRYIGRTNSHIFLYRETHQKENYTTLISTEDVKRINIETDLNWLCIP